MPYNFVLAFEIHVQVGIQNSWSNGSSGTLVWNEFHYYLPINDEMILIIQKCFCEPWHLVNCKQMQAIFSTTGVRQSSLYVTITFYTCARLVSSWTNGERAVLSRSKGALCTYAYGNCGSLKCCQNRWTLLCVLGMILKGSIDLAQKTIGEVTRNSGICSDFH